MASKELKEAFKASIPIMLGYGVLGFTFGLIAIKEKIQWYFVIAMSLFIYAGALQFIGISLIKAKAGIIDTFITSIFVNFRQIFYGLSVLKKFKKAKFKSYLIFALTDETYALITTIKPSSNLKKTKFYLYLSLLNHSYWVLGTILGVIFATFVEFNLKGLSFALTSLFVVLAIEQYKNIKKITPFLIGALSFLVAFLVVGKKNLLVVAIFIAIFIILINFKRQGSEK
jgi:4-azaleucine resistance transporter AzlC